MTWGLIVAAVVVSSGLLMVISRYFSLWIQAYTTGTGIGLISLMLMSLRKVNPKAIVQCKIMAVQAGLSNVPTAALEAQYLAGGNVQRVTSALIIAHRANVELDWDTAAAIDLAGRNILEAVQVSVIPKTINCPDPEVGRGDTLDGVAKDGIQLKVRVRVTVRTNVSQLIGGATESTVIARIGEGIVSAIGSCATYQTASIAANNDREIGKCIADSMVKVGKDGVVTIDEGKGLTTEVEWVQGMAFDKGYLSPYFVTNVERMESELDDAYVLIHEKKLSNVKDLLPLLELVAKSGKPLLIIAEDVEGEALTTLVVNQLRGTFHCCAVKSPAYGDRRKALLEDIAILTGGTAIMENLGTTLASLTLDDLGRAKRVVIGNDNTTLIEGAGKKDSIKARVTQIDNEYENSTSDYDREQLQARKAKLSGGVAKISVGGPTESEVKQKKMRFEDALNATRAAVEEGVLPGGGVGLLRASAACKPKGLSHDEAAGYNIIRRACKSPLYWIAENAGQPGSVVVETVRKGEVNYGFNAATNVYEDMIKAGVIDSTKVVRTALENAASVWPRCYSPVVP